MDAIALLLVLAAAVFHAVWNVTLHGTVDRVATMAVAALGGAVLLSPWIIAQPPVEAAAFLLPSVAAQTVYALALSAAYQRGALAFTYPVGRGTSPVLVTLGGWLLLGQGPGLTGLAGAALVASGLAVLAQRAGRVGQAHAVGFALLVGGAIASYSLVDAAAVQLVAPAGYLGAVLGIHGVVLTAGARLGPARLKASLGPGLRVAVGSVAAYLLVLMAFQRGDAGPVATLRELSVILGVFLAREHPGWRAWCGAILCATGAVLAAL